MKKRMLCLLLALVMTLSLCVPALAADEFAAEAVTEVEEQAPVAPVEPEAPEAEEPAEEPVVDEPAAEEPVEAVEDAPEMASIMPEDAEDLPYLVSLGVVSGTAHYNLEKIIAKADEIMPKVEAGELFVKASYTSGTEVFTDDYAPAKAFTDAYATAKKNLDAINGITVDIDVNTQTVQNAIDALKALLPEDDGTYKAAGLTDDISGVTDMDTAALIKALKAGDSYDNSAKKYLTNYPIEKTDDTHPTTKEALDTPDWTMSYNSDYLAALKTAQEAIKVFDATEEKTFKDFSTAAKAVLAAAKLEAAAAKPGAADADALAAAIKKAEAIGSDKYTANSEKGDYAAPNNDLFADTSSGVIKTAKTLLSDTQGLNGLATGVLNYDVRKATKDINDALTLKANTLKVEETKATAANTISIKFSIAQIGGNTDTDSNTYAYAVKVNGNYLDSDSAVQKKLTDKCYNDLTGWAADTSADPTRLYKTETVTHFSDTAVTGNFSASDKITLYLYLKQTIDGKTSYLQIKEEPITFPTQTYFGPTIKSAKVTDYEATDATASLKDVKLAGTEDALDSSSDIAAIAGSGNLTVSVTMSANATISQQHRLAVRNSSNKATGTADDSFKSTAADSTTVTVTAPTADFKATGMRVALDVNTETGANATESVYLVEQCSVPLPVKALSTWSEVKYINKILDEAGKLVQSDYDLNPANVADDGYIIGRGDINSVATAFSTITKDINKIKTAISDTSKANTPVNRTDVLNNLHDLGEVYGYLKAKAVDVKALTDLQYEIRQLDEDDYTYDSWGKLQDAVKDSEDALKDPVLQSKVNAALSALQAAKNALTKPGAVDKTALNASITAAKALKEEDYTPESWAANEAAIDAAVKAAEAVAANENATQTQVDTAKTALDAAVAKLEKVGGEEEPPAEGPKAPASGTGWTLYNNEWYFFKNGTMVKNYWVGQADGASQWSTNWYYVGSDGKMATGMQYLDDLHGGYGWYFLQPTNTKGEIGKMLTGYQWVGGQYGECYFSKKSGESGKCTWSELLGNWNGTTWVK